MAKKFSFSYPYASYMDVSLMRETKTRKELLAEYKAMQAEANRRLRGLEKYKWTQESQAYQYNKDRFKGGVSRMTKEQLSKQMREAAIFLGSQTSTVQGQRRQRDRMLDTFRESWGLEFLNRRNVADFVRFLGAARAHFGAAHYSMDEVEALFKTARREKLDMYEIERNFSNFADRAMESPNYAKYMREAAERFSSEDYEG
mgnify:CR=1 FL=1